MPRLPSPHPGASYAGRKQGSGPQLRATGRRLPSPGPGREAGVVSLGTCQKQVAVYSVDPWRCGKLTSATALCAWFKLVSHVYELDLVQELVRAVLWRRGVGGGVLGSLGLFWDTESCNHCTKGSNQARPVHRFKYRKVPSVGLPCVRVCARASGHRTGAAARTEGTSTCAAWR